MSNGQFALSNLCMTFQNGRVLVIQYDINLRGRNAEKWYVFPTVILDYLKSKVS